MPRALSVTLLCMLMGAVLFGCQEQTQRTSADTENDYTTQASRDLPGPAPSPAPVFSSSPTPAGALPQLAEPVPSSAREYDVVKTWDFCDLPKERQDWIFPSGPGKPTAEGARVFGGLLGTQAMLHLRRADVRASEVDAIRITCGWRNPNHPETPLKAPEAVHVFWAHTADYEQGEWPYSNDRSLRLESITGSPRSFEGVLGGRDQWTGTIDDIGIGITLPNPSVDAEIGHIVVSSIALLKMKNASGS